MAEQRRLLVIYTGGTLGMVPTPLGHQPGADVHGWLQELVEEHFPTLDWDAISLEPLIDSSNATQQDWQRILDTIEAYASHFDAFVILHGTDTMAYTAAAVACALPRKGDVPLPVVITGAQRSLVAVDSDADGNVVGAIRAALDARFSGVAVFFDRILLDGRYATKVSSAADDGFASPNHLPMARLRRDGLAFFRTVPQTPLLAGPLKPFVPVDLVVLTLHPGLSAQRVVSQLTPTPQGIVLRAYGTGNAPDNDPELLAALTKASGDGAVVVATTQCGHGGVALGHYAVSQALMATGAVSGETLPPEAIVARLSFLISQGLSPDEVRETFRAAS